MRKLIVQEWISLDGFATDKYNKLDFFAPTVRDVYKDEYYEKCLNSVGCILFGKNTYTQFSNVWPERNGEMMAEKINTSQKIVFSKSLTDAPWGKWEPATIVSSDLKLKIKELKSVTGQNIIIWGSLSVAQQAAKDQLVDEYHIHICPVINGRGRRLFTDENDKDLQLLHSKIFDNGVVSLHYQV